MKWWPFNRKTEKHENDMDQDVDAKLRQADYAFAREAERIPEIVKAVVAARRVRYRVDRFTAEIDESFRRFNHG